MALVSNITTTHNSQQLNYRLFKKQVKEPKTSRIANMGATIPVMAIAANYAYWPDRGKSQT
jgi:hypothetical protein